MKGIQEMSTYTVIGVWMDSNPIVVGVIEGEHKVYGGDDPQFPDGIWGTSVGADSAEDAERAAVAEMRHLDGQYGNDPWYVSGKRFNDHKNDIGDWCPYSLSRIEVGADEDQQCPQGCQDSHVEDIPEE